MEALLAAIDTPPDCQGLLNAAQALTEIAELARRHGVTLDWVDLDKLDALSRRALSLPRTDWARYPHVDIKTDKVPQGLATHHPLFALLTPRTRSVQFQRHVAGIKLAALQIYPTLNAAGEGRRMAAAVRAFCTGANAQTLDQLGSPIICPRALLSFIDKTYRHLPRNKAPDPWKTLRYVIEIAFGREPADNRGRGGAKGGGTHGWWQSVLDDQAMPEAHAASQFFGEEHRRSKVNMDPGIDPGEPCVDRPDLLVLQFPALPDYLDAERRCITQGETAYLNVERAVRLAISSSTMSDEAIAVLAETVTRTALSDDPALDPGIRMAATSLLVALLHGLSVTASCRAIRDALLGEDPCDFAFIDIEGGALVVPTGYLQFYSAPDEDWADHVRRVTPYLCFSLCPALKQAIARLQSLPLGRNDRYFTPGTLEKAAEAIARQIAQDAYVIVSAGRVPLVLRDILYRVGADPADVVLMIGDVDRSISWQCTYQWRPVNEINALHEKAVSVLLESVPNDTRVLLTPPRQFEVNECHGVGSVRTPTREAVQRLVQGLRSEVAHTRTMRDRIAYHNARVIELSVLLTFATASRPTMTRFQRRSDFGDDFEFAIVSDKDDLWFSGARCLPLPRFVRTALMDHARHAAEVMDWIDGIHPGPAKALRKFAFGEPFRDRDRELQVRDQSAGFLFLLSPELYPVTLTLSDIQSHIKPYYRAPLYTLRHFMRTELRALGVEPEAVAFLMGHWDAHSSPHHPHSVFAVEDQSNLVNALEMLIDLVGWNTPKGHK